MLQNKAKVGFIYALIITFTLVSAAEKKEIKMGSLDNLIKEHVIPDVIDAKPSISLKVNYSSSAEVLQGNELTPTQVKSLPEFHFEAQEKQLYTLAMVDPDAPSRTDPKLREILHYLVVNIPGGDLSKGETLAEYIGSGPPKGTGLHRYVFLLYGQNNKNLTSEMKISRNSRTGRPKFSIRKFAKENHLGEPIAANFYLAQYDEYVPLLHAQLTH